MTNPYFSPSGNPGTGSAGLSSVMRSEFANVSAGFDLLPALAGNGGKIVVINPGGTALDVLTGTLTVPGLAVTNNATISGTFGVAGAVSGAGFVARFSSPGPIGDAAASTGAFTTLGATTSVVSPKFGAAAAGGLNLSSGGNGTTITFGDPGYGIGSIGTMTFASGAMAMLINGQIQSIRYTNGVNAYAPASTALTALIRSGASVTGTIVGAGAWNSLSVASDSADFRLAADNCGKVLDIQYNFSSGAQGARSGIWAQMNPVGLTHVIDMVALSGNITASSDMAGSFLQPLATICGVTASGLNVGSTLNEFDYYAEANVVGVKGALQITLARGDLFQGLTADAGIFFSNSNDYNTSPGMKNMLGIGISNQGFPVGLNGAIMSVILQTVNQGSAQNVQFIQPATTSGIDFELLNTSIQSGHSFRGAGFHVDGTGQVLASQGLLLGRSGANYTIDVPGTFAVNSIAVNIPGVPLVLPGSSLGNYYPGDVISGSGSPKGQYQITHCKVLSAAVTAGGSGGTNGAQVVTLGGGSGSAATVNVTVAGGAITAVNSIATPGDYTAFPVNLNTVPVTGAGLTGATLAVGMGALTVAILVPDVFATNITAITPIGGSGTGLTLTATNQVRAGLSLQPTSGGTLRVGPSLMTANGSVATALSSVGPAGANTTVQEWFTVTNSSGVVRYIPAF